MPDLIPCIKSIYSDEMESIKLVGVRDFVKHIRDNLEMELPQAKIEIIDITKMEIADD